MDIVTKEPINKLKLLKNVPLDESYSDTLDFSSVSEQISYFSSKSAHSFNDLTPIKANNVIRLPINAQLIYECNYLMYQNIQFDAKWFYCFITDVEYVTDVSCNVKVQMDIMQTWLFNYELKQCFVEREHIDSAKDYIGSNLVEENIDVGEYVNVNEIISATGDSIRYLVAVTEWYTFDTQGNIQWYKSEGHVEDGVYTGLTYVVFKRDVTDAGGLNEFIAQYNTSGKTDAIINIQCLTSGFIPDGEDYNGNRLAYVDQQYTDLVPMIKNPNGYTPRNKKLYTYPYNFLNVYNCEGGTNIYKYEYFSDPDNSTFKVRTVSVNKAQAQCIPFNYKGVALNIEEDSVMSNFPFGSWNSDVYKIWLAQNSVSNALSLGSSIGTAGIGVFTGNPVAIAGGVMGVANKLGEFADRKGQPDSTHGGNSSISPNFNDKYVFRYTQKCLTKERFEILDNYFDMYGYACHRVKTPETRNRAFWNYVKTIDAKIIGNIPLGDLNKIKNIYNAGITIWHTEDVGDYTKNNF